MSKITQKQWEEYVITTAMLAGWEDSWTRAKQGTKWRRAMQYLEEKKGMHICINGDIIQTRYPQEK
jgi:hypothetical protein